MTKTGTWKRKMVMVLCLLLMLSVIAPTGYAEARYTRISTFVADLTISSSGLASCYSNVKSSVSTDKIELTMNLQQYSGGAWKTIKSWDTSGTGTVSLSKTWYVSSGYSYRVQAIAYVYDSSGTLQESPTAYSSTVTY